MPLRWASVTPTRRLAVASSKPPPLAVWATSAASSTASESAVVLARTVRGVFQLAVVKTSVVGFSVTAGLSLAAVTVTLPVGWPERRTA